MKISELIERLTDIHEEFGDVNVEGVFQPDYPLISDIDSITTLEGDSGQITVFIGLGDGSEYGCRKHYADTYVTMRDDEGDE